MRYKYITIYADTNRGDDELVTIVETALVAAGVDVLDTNVAEVEHYNRGRPCRLPRGHEGKCSDGRFRTSCPEP